MSSRKPRDSKVGTITTEVDKDLGKHYELQLQELCSIRGNHTLLDMFFMELRNRQENWTETRGNNRYSDNSRTRREFNRFESQGVADNQRFDGRRRGGQSDHRFHNQGGRQGVSWNSAFRGQTIGVSSRPKLTGIVRGKAFLHVLRRRPIGCLDSRKRTL
ncbi:uncharacterized protein TNCV_819211 [Trichonephila clavipes]|nr:uncharacterized protein TNCV_819211 [Trichonephila clavipes]